MPGIQRDKIMEDKLMYIPTKMIHKITPSVDYNQWLKRWDTQSNKPTNQNPITVPKVVKPTNKKSLGTTVINSPMSPPFLPDKSTAYITF